MQHLWHDIEVGSQSPAIVTTIIEIPKGCHAKYEIDKKTGLISLDRVLPAELCYPFNYGFIPQTYGPDNDPLDTVVLCSTPLVPLSMVTMRVLGVMLMEDGGEDDHKIIGVAQGDYATKEVNSLDELLPGTLDAIESFFSYYKKHQNKHVVVKGFLDKHEAYELINKSIKDYTMKFNK